MRTKLATLAALVALGLNGCGGAGGGSTGYHPYDAPQISNAQKKEFLDAVNEARSQTQDCGTEGIFPPAPPLKWNDGLYSAAAEHSHDMAVTDHYEHEGSGTESDWTAKVQKLGRPSEPWERIYNSIGRDNVSTDENIAAEYSENIDEAMRDWIDSPHHCSQIMKMDYTHVGIAQEKGTWHYWSQEFYGE